jgi:hypothetical protein
MLFSLCSASLLEFFFFLQGLLLSQMTNSFFCLSSIFVTSFIFYSFSLKCLLFLLLLRYYLLYLPSIIFNLFLKWCYLLYTIISRILLPNFWIFFSYLCCSFVSYNLLKYMLGAGDVPPGVEHLLSMLEALGSVPVPQRSKPANK